MPTAPHTLGIPVHACAHWCLHVFHSRASVEDTLGCQHHSAHLNKRWNFLRIYVPLGQLLTSDQHVHGVNVPVPFCPWVEFSDVRPTLSPELPRRTEPSDPLGALLETPPPLVSFSTHTLLPHWNGNTFPWNPWDKWLHFQMNFPGIS